MSPDEFVAGRRSRSLFKENKVPPQFNANGIGAAAVPPRPEARQVTSGRGRRPRARGARLGRRQHPRRLHRLDPRHPARWNQGRGRRARSLRRAQPADGDPQAGAGGPHRDGARPRGQAPRGRDPVARRHRPRGRRLPRQGGGRQPRLSRHPHQAGGARPGPPARAAGPRDGPGGRPGDRLQLRVLPSASTGPPARSRGSG